VAEKGYVLIHRKIWDNVLFCSGERFDRRSAWLYIVMHAQHIEGSFMVKGRLFHVHRGQLFTSIRYLAQIWRWDKTTVSRFLSDIETEKMITVTRTQNGTLITVLNYNKYQASGGRTSQKADTESDTESVADSDTQPSSESTLLKNVKKNVLRNQKKGTCGGQVIE